MKSVSWQCQLKLREKYYCFCPRKKIRLHQSTGWYNFKSILILNDTYMVLPTATETAPVRQRQYYINAEERNIKVSFYPQTINTHPPIYIIN